MNAVRAADQLCCCIWDHGSGLRLTTDRHCSVHGIQGRLAPAGEKLRLAQQRRNKLKEAEKHQKARDEAQVLLDECMATAKRIREQMEML